MKKLLLLTLVLLGGVMQVSADDPVGTTTTVYYAIPSATVGTYTVKLNVARQYDAGQAHNFAQYTMTKIAKKTYNGKDIYTCTYTDWYNGVGKLEFQLYDGDKADPESTEIVINSWTNVSTYNEKIHEKDGSGWSTYEPDCLKGSWDTFTDPIYFEDGVATKNITAGDEIKFKFILAGTWYGAANAGATMFWDDSSNWTFTSPGNDCYIHTAVAGTYTFTLDAANKKISVTFPDYTKNEVYFCNNHNWVNTPIVYLLDSDYWDDEDNKGSGSPGKSGQYGDDKGHAMTRVGETNIWKLEYPSTLNSQYIAIVKDRQDNYTNFWNTEAVYKDNFNSSKPLYVPNMTGPINMNYTDNNEKWTAYWNDGEWHAYPTYTRLTTEGKFGTICLPFAATVTGATVYSLDSKVMDGDNLKGVNLSVVENLAAGTSYIFKATGTTLTATYSGSYSDAIAGAMVGNLSSNTKDVPEGDYIIYNNSITKAGTGVTIGQYRGYIDISAVPEASALSKDFIAVDGEEETDGINSVHGVELNSSEMYNLSGQKVSSNYKGIVIQNGKKLINK